MPVELLDPTADAGVDSEYPVHAQLRAAAPGHAHDAAIDPHARRRDDRQGRAGHWLSAQRVREAGRRPRLQSVRDHRRPDELHLAGRQRDRLAPYRRETAGHRDHAAVQIRPHDPRRIGPYQRPPALRRGGRPRPRRADGLPVRLQRTRARSTTSSKQASGQRFHPSLLPRRRPHGRRDGRVGRSDPRVREVFPEGPRAMSPGC